MNRWIFDAAAARFPLREGDPGEFAVIRGRGMTFRVRVFDAPGAGGLCLMEMRAFGGLMKMETAVFSPTGRDGPLFSTDLIEAAGKDTLLLELYDTTASHPGFAPLGECKARHAALPAHDPGEHWYDSMRLGVSDFKKGKGLLPAFEAYAQDYAREYFSLLADCPLCDEAEKKKRNAAYTDGMLQHGRPAVSQFVRMIGEEKTAAFLRRCMFRAE